MDHQGPDRNALIGVLLISVILAVWLLFFTPRPPMTPEAPLSTAQDSVAAEEPAEIGPPAGVAEAPTDSLFAAATEGEARLIVVETDRYVATFSTRGGTLVSFRMQDYLRAGSREPVDLVQSAEAGALAVVFNPPQGRLVDTRALTFRPSTGGGAFEGDTLRATDAPATLVFEAPVGGGTIRLAYTFAPDDYLVGLQVSAPGTDVLARSGGYELVWDGAIPQAEANPAEEATNAGAYVRWGGDTDRIQLTRPGTVEPVTATGQVDWVAVKTKYFIAALIPDGETTTEGAELEGVRTSEPGQSAFAEHFTARLAMPRPTANRTDAFRLYLGPMEIQRLGHLGLYDTVEFGFGQTLTRPIARYVVNPTLVLLKRFIPSYGLVIILFALLVKIVLWPLTATTFKNAARMRELQPKMEVVKEKYGDNPQKQQEEMMRVYREAGVNPLGGCLPMLLQYPLLIALWRFFQSTLILRQHGFLWAEDLSAPDVILQLPFHIPLYGDFVAGFTLLMGLSMLAQMKLTSQPGGMTGQMKVMMYMMPAVFFIFFNGLPSGLSLYYLAFNVFSIAQQYLVNKTLKPAEATVEVKGTPRQAKGSPGAARNGKAAAQGRATATRKAK